MSASQADPPSNDQRRTAASQHSASNAYTFGQATSNPPISHHRALAWLGDTATRLQVPRYQQIYRHL
ncbi:hypothetical protein I7I51_08817 [Histoplasma capsulatum]|uniref:Uncharacterized protein n=1 Tax=Ajellomyces capsulatus TaxID=5037 RepID=A0A8A1M4K5_AJECA|nr:hypothetical protein I7I51_08817 [Histoplasma capsulatum]